MGAYFRCYRTEKFVKKTLIKKVGGSPYPNIKEFTRKIECLKKYLGDFVAETEINYDGKRIRLKQQKIDGEDIFVFLNRHKNLKPQKFEFFLEKLNKLYKETSILPDLLNKDNIIVSKDSKINIIDIWPLFFEERVNEGDLNRTAYRENLQKFELLKEYLNNK